MELKPWILARAISAAASGTQRADGSQKEGELREGESGRRDERNEGGQAGSSVH